jgi:hypothetical protein
LDPNIATNELAASAAIRTNVYPNPTQGLTTIAYSLNTSAKAQLIIRDITGRVVSTQSNNANLDGKFTVDAASLAPGVYTYAITAGAENATGELIVR